MLSHLFISSGDNATILQWIAFKNHVVGWAFGFGETQKCNWGMGRLDILPKRWHGDKASHCHSWKPMSSNAMTSSCERFVPTFTNHTVIRFAQSITHFLLPSMQQLMSFTQNQNSIDTWLFKWNSFFKPLKVGIGVPCLHFPPLTLHGCPCVGLQHMKIFLQWIRQFENMSLR